ncbi:g7936 [Coccomyxa elongata]
MARSHVLAILKRSHLRVKLPASQQHYSASLSTTAGKELSSLLGFPSNSWPLASAVVRELLGGGRSQTSTSKLEPAADSVPQPTVATVISEARQPNRALAELLELDSSPPTDGEDLARRVVGPLQRLCPQLDNLSPAEITTLVAALGHFRVKDSLVDIVLEAVSDIVTDSVQQYTAPQLATICGSYVELDHRGSGYTLLLDAIVGQVLRSFKDLDARGLVALTHALAETEHESEGTGKLLAAIAAGALDLVPTFTPGQLVSLLASFSRLHHYNEPMYRAIARQAAPTVSTLQLQQQSDLLHALALMGHDEPQLVAALRGHLLENAEQLAGFALCDVLWSLAVLDQLSLESFRHMCGRLEQLTLGSFEPENFQQLYQVQRIVQAASEDPVTVQLPAWIWVYAASAWQDRLFAESNFTPLQQSICRTLDDMGIWHEEKFLQNMTSAIALHDKVTIHPEGPSCYSSSWPKRALGETLAVRRTLARHGWTVVPIAKHEWMALASQKRRGYLAKLLEDVGAL